MNAKQQYFIGTSGWSYPQWKHSLYAGVPQSKWLARYSEIFSTVEVNNSFYRLPTEKAITGWKDKTPPDFVFSAKAWRGITHYARLRHCEDNLEQCLSLFSLFDKKLGTVLFQLPPGLQRDDALLKDFLKLLPANIHAVFEFRHASWQHKAVLDMLRAAKATLCQAHMKNWLSLRDMESELLYIRMHGVNAWFKGGYSDAFLKKLAASIHESKAKTVYVFFNNTYFGDDALDNAKLLQQFCSE